MRPALIGASLIGTALFQLVPAAAQDMAAMEKWAKVEIVHYEVVGEFTRKHVQIPPTDADLVRGCVRARDAVLRLEQEEGRDRGHADNPERCGQECPTSWGWRRSARPES
jgi:hypothetical protein